MPSVSTAEERISELEEKSLEIMQTDTQEKKVKKTEHCTQELWDNIKWSNTHLIDYLAGKEGKTCTEEIFESIMERHFSKIIEASNNRSKKIRQL